MAFDAQKLPLKLLSEISFQIETVGAKVLTGFSNALRLEMIKNAKNVPLSKNPWYVTPNENFRETPFVRPSKRIPKKAKLVDAGAWYAHFLEYGTTPHDVKGKRSPKKWMRFEDKLGVPPGIVSRDPSTKEIIRFTARSKVDGKVYVFSKKEKHGIPGKSTPNPFQPAGYVRKTADAADSVLEKYLSTEEGS